MADGRRAYDVTIVYSIFSNWKDYEMCILYNFMWNAFDHVY